MIPNQISPYPSTKFLQSTDTSVFIHHSFIHIPLFHYPVRGVVVTVMIGVQSVLVSYFGVKTFRLLRILVIFSIREGECRNTILK